MLKKQCCYFMKLTVLKISYLIVLVVLYVYSLHELQHYISGVGSFLKYVPIVILIIHPFMYWWQHQFHIRVVSLTLLNEAMFSLFGIYVTLIDIVTRGYLIWYELWHSVLKMSNFSQTLCFIKHWCLMFNSAWSRLFIYTYYPSLFIHLPTSPFILCLISLPSISSPVYHPHQPLGWCGCIYIYIVYVCIVCDDYYNKMK